MTREDVIRMAQEAGFEIDCCSLEWHERIERFADLAAAYEREECAQMLERTDLSALKNDIGLQVWFGKMFMGFAEAIRARGKG